MTSNIIQLNNPRTETYNEFKRIIRRLDFNWNYYPRTDETSTPAMLSHAFIKRPNELRYPTVHCDGANFVHDVVQEILNHNDIRLDCIYRLNLNMVFPEEGNRRTPEHVDHLFPHDNIIIYFSSEGKTIVGNDEHDPKEDDVIMFPGLPHCQELPKNDMRLVLVATCLTSKL
jgi:hypothetical protein|tara:strand:- start:41 stop:556 length:516 start_codon:yes stop_codon:yes gene_type:complete